MESHLLDPGHRDVVSMMNGSVPIMIGRQRGLPCAGCDRRFRYNLQLRIHAKETGHEESLTASDEYQQRIRCKSCPRVVRSLVALQRHQLSCHAAKTAREGDAAPYFCSFCSMNFATAREAVLHRRTSSHKEVVKARKCSEAVVGRQCPHCEEKQANLSAHKSHLLDRHPELCYRRVAAPLRVARLPSVSRTCVGFQVPEVRHALRPVPRRDQAHEGEQVPRGGGVEDQGGRVEVRRVQLLDRLPLGVHLPRGASRGPRERRESGPRGQVLVPRLRQGVRQGVAEESHQEPHGGEAVPVRQVPGPLLEEVRPERPSEGVRGAVVGRLAGCRAARPEARLRLLRVQQRFLHQVRTRSLVTTMGALSDNAFITHGFPASARPSLTRVCLNGCVNVSRGEDRFVSLRLRRKKGGEGNGGWESSAVLTSRSVAPVSPRVIPPFNGLALWPVYIRVYQPT